MQFEGVGAVSVCGFLLQVARQVDDRQRSKRTFLKKKTKTEFRLEDKVKEDDDLDDTVSCAYLDADAAAYTQRL